MFFSNVFWFWCRSGSVQIHSQSDLLFGGGDAVVPPPWRPAGIHRLLHSSGYVVSTNYSNSAAGYDCVNKVCCFWIRGAGCIFIEMLQGAPAFPGVSDEFEQLQKIWEVSNTVYITGPRNSTTLWYYTVIICTLSTNTIDDVTLQVLGLSSEDSWPGVSLLPNYRPGTFR